MLQLEVYAMETRAEAVGLKIRQIRWKSLRDERMVIRI
jgi:hypothetical protein